MGEKIRDISEIRICDSKFTIELNEGYTADEGRLIHVQNKHLRYLINQKGFMEFASTILRAREEMLFFKSCNSEVNKKKENDDILLYDSFRNISSKFNSILSDLLSENIQFRIVDYSEKIITIILSQNNITLLRKR